MKYKHIYIAVLSALHQMRMTGQFKRSTETV